MWHKLLKIVLHGSLFFFICACGYRYETIRCIRELNVPRQDSQMLTVKVNFTAYIAYMRNNSDTARINNDAVNRIAKGDVDGALALLHTTISSQKPAVLNNYGIALILKGDFESGLEYIYKAAALNPYDPYFRKNYLYLNELKK